MPFRRSVGLAEWVTTVACFTVVSPPAGEERESENVQVMMDDGNSAMVGSDLRLSREPRGLYAST